MSDKATLNKIPELLEEIKSVVTNKSWSYSKVRLNILLTKKLDELKDIESNIYNEIALADSEALFKYYGELITKINEILNELSRDEFPFQYYEFELFRLNYATLYANLWGEAGELQVAGAATALANVLIGIQTLNVEDLEVDWDHPEFHKRRKLILNYLSAAFNFFFTLCASLFFIHEEDMHMWLSEGLKASELYLKYVKKFWNVKKSVELDTKYRKGAEANLSPFYAAFAGVTDIIIDVASIPHFILNFELKELDGSKFFDIKNTEQYFESLRKLLDFGDYLIADFKDNVKKGVFDINDDPLNHPLIIETITDFKIAKIYYKAMYVIYRLIEQGISTEINILNNNVLPELFEYIDGLRNLAQTEQEFINSQLADTVGLMLEELLYYAGLVALKTKDNSRLQYIEQNYSYFFSDKAIERYPSVSGLYYLIKLTLALNEELNDNLLNSLHGYADKFRTIAEYNRYDHKNAFSFLLLSNLLLLLNKELTADAFIEKMDSVMNEFFAYLPQQLNEEIEIYLSNLKMIFSGEKVSINISRLVNIKFYDPMTVFVPEIEKLAKAIGYEGVVYLPFNLLDDTVIRRAPRKASYAGTVMTTQVLEQKRTNV